MYCSKCGKPIDAGDLFCKWCGAELSQVPEFATPEIKEKLKGLTEDAEESIRVLDDFRHMST